MSLKTLYKKTVEYKRLHFNLVKTIWFNFKAFNFSVARRLPVYIYGKIRVEQIHRGSIVLMDVRRGGVRIGGGLYNELIGYSRSGETFISIKGQLFLGTNIYILQGAVFSICENASALIDNNVIINKGTVIHCKRRIDIGANTRIGWNCQILDTDFHYMIKDGVVAYRNKEIVIGHNVWLANGVSVTKGTILPAYSIVAQKSLVNKDYSQFGDHCLFGGIPARFIANNVERILNKEAQIDDIFDVANNYKEPLNYSHIKDQLA